MTQINKYPESKVCEVNQHGYTDYALSTEPKNNEEKEKMVAHLKFVVNDIADFPANIMVFGQVELVKKCTERINNLEK